MTQLDDWEEELLSEGLSKRTVRSGGAYAGPGSASTVATPAREDFIAFNAGIPDPSVLPTAGLQAAMLRVFETESQAALEYGGDQGLLPLRSWMAEHWSAIDQLALTADNFCLTNGSAGALVNICETFLDEGDLVLFESPSFPGSIRAIRSIGAVVEPVPLDREGLDVVALEEKLESLSSQGKHAKLLYTIPSFHNPTGTCLTLERRHQLVEVCQHYKVLVVEDDAYGELGFEPQLLPSLYSLAGGPGIIRVGSFSKTIATGLRVGWSQATPEVFNALRSTRFDMGHSPLVQRMIFQFAVTGELESHIKKLRAFYAHKKDVTLNELRECCSDTATWEEPLGGFYVWLELNPEIDPLRLQQTAEAEGVGFVGGRRFFADLFFADDPGNRGLAGASDSPYIRLAFSEVAEELIPEGIRRLARAMNLARR